MKIARPVDLEHGEPQRHPRLLRLLQQAPDDSGTQAGTLPWRRQLNLQ